MPTNLLINLPPSFHTTPATRAVLDRAIPLVSQIRRASWNTPDEIAADLAWADAVLWWSWPALDDALIARAPQLRWSGQLDVSRTAAATALRRGLPVSLARRCWSPAVSEMALGLILCLLRRIGDHHAAMRANRESWVADFPADIDVRERELTGRRVGLIGFGQVGRRLRELLVPFGCPVTVHDPFLAADVATQTEVRPGTIAELVADCDVVVLCAAANDGTRHLLGAAELAALRPGAVLINVARAALVDTAALERRLAVGDVVAAIDVFDQEPLPAAAGLRTLDNAYLTPHRAGGVMASVERGLGWLVDDLTRHLQGEPLQHALSAAMLPGLDG